MGRAGNLEVALHRFCTRNDGLALLLFSVDVCDLCCIAASISSLVGSIIDSSSATHFVSPVD